MDAILIQVGMYAGMVIGIANIITASFPSIGENKYYNFVMKVLNALSMNFGKNKNADAVK